MEQIFSSRVLEFFERKGYTIEAEYVRMIRDWRRACDERGLAVHNEPSTTTTCLIMSWMSWCHGMANQDCVTSAYLRSTSKHTLQTIMKYSYYNTFFRDITTGRGFTRETLSALLVNIESREWRRQYNLSNGNPPEHPNIDTPYTLLLCTLWKYNCLRPVSNSWYFNSCIPARNSPVNDELDPVKWHRSNFFGQYCFVNII